MQTATTRTVTDPAGRYTASRMGLGWRVVFAGALEVEAASWDARLPAYVRRGLVDALGPVTQFEPWDTPLVVDVARGLPATWQTVPA